MIDDSYLVFSNRNVYRSVGKLKGFLFPSFVVLSIVSLILFQPLSSIFLKATAAGSDPRVSCNCVVFRMDDVQDYFVSIAQVAAMNIFVSKGQPLSLGLIMNYTGNDSSIINKVSEGYKKGLFELGLHGWDHVDYTKLSEDEQRISLLNANEKMQRLFGNKSDVFIPPYNEFNNGTIKAMMKVNLKVLSSSLYEEENLNQGKDIFIDKGNNNYASTSSPTIPNVNDIEQARSPIVYHLPETNEFERYQNHTWIKIPVDKILRDTFESIDNYGYAVISLQPQSFIKADNAGRPNFTNHEIDAHDLEDLSLIIDTLLKNKVKIVSFSDIVK
jgi:peptidoglycan/xylan/chitin deacetylase (PgdA/CDA1 family)